MSGDMMSIDDELAFIQAMLHSHKKNVVYNIKGMEKSIIDLAESVHKIELKLDRKEMVIKGLQGSLKNIAKGKKILENKLAEVDGRESEIDKLREENKALKAKYKTKARKLRQYKLLLADNMDDEYEEDPDEEDGDPSDDSAGVEDISMVDAKTLLSESDDDTDIDDSDFELEEDEKAKMKAEMKAEMKDKEFKGDKMNDKEVEKDQMKDIVHSPEAKEAEVDEIDANNNEK